MQYNCDTYLIKCRQARLLTLEKRFDFNDLVLFYKISNNLVPLSLPPYLNFFDGYSRLRSCHLDTFSIVSEIQPKVTPSFSDNKNSALNKSFFYRTYLLWNSLPLEIRAVTTLSLFKTKLLKFMWDSVSHENCEISDHDVLLEEMFIE